MDLSLKKLGGLPSRVRGDLIINHPLPYKQPAHHSLRSQDYLSRMIGNACCIVASNFTQTARGRLPTMENGVRYISMRLIFTQTRFMAQHIVQQEVTVV